MSSVAEPNVFSPLRWEADALVLLDQTRLPMVEEWLTCRSPADVASAIRRLSIRGAPAIGVATAFGLVLGVDPRETDRDALIAAFEATCELLLSTRPTAVNLGWALERGKRVFSIAMSEEKTAAEIRHALREWAEQLHREDIETNIRIGHHGKALFAEGDRVLTHCNAGALATGGFGTAVGVIQASWEAGCLGSVWVDETRPLLQGARLTTWELKRLGIPFRLITDSSAGFVMARGRVDRIVVGADRIAANGDVANKIGTYTVAVLAHRHGVPFYVAAPLSTIDLATCSGDSIPIEERSEGEVVDVFGSRIAPDETAALNLAFDVTPAELVGAIITEVGVLRPPYTAAIQKAFDRQAGD